MARNAPRIRPERVAERIRTEIAEILQREIKDPRVGLTTCTRVRVSRDLKNAVIYVSILGEKEKQVTTVEALQHATGFVRRLLGRRLGMRSAPEVQFVFDPSVEFGIRLEKLIDDARSSEEAESDEESESG